MGKKIAVIAGGPVDTDMGVDVLRSAGLDAYSYPAAEAAREQTEFQMAPAEVRTEKVRGIMKEAIADGMSAFMIYCNSLSSTVDVEGLGRELGVQVVTPLQQYKKLAKNYDLVAVMTGNNQGAAGIERAIMEANDKSTVIGTGALPLVIAVEDKIDPAEMVENFGLKKLVAFYEAVGCEAIILGCTHFPWFGAELAKCTKLPVIDPADMMCEDLR